MWVFGSFMRVTYPCTCRKIADYLWLCELFERYASYHHVIRELSLTYANYHYLRELSVDKRFIITGYEVYYADKRAVSAIYGNVPSRYARNHRVSPGYASYPRYIWGISMPGMPVTGVCYARYIRRCEFCRWVLYVVPWCIIVEVYNNEDILILFSRNNLQKRYSEFQTMVDSLSHRDERMITFISFEWIAELQVSQYVLLLCDSMNVQCRFVVECTRSSGRSCK